MRWRVKCRHQEGAQDETPRIARKHDELARGVGPYRRRAEDLRENERRQTRGSGAPLLGPATQDRVTEGAEDQRGQQDRARSRGERPPRSRNRRVAAKPCRGGVSQLVDPHAEEDADERVAGAGLHQ